MFDANTIKLTLYTLFFPHKYAHIGDVDGPSHRALDRRGNREEILDDRRRHCHLGIPRKLEGRVVHGTQDAVLREQENERIHLGFTGRVGVGTRQSRGGGYFVMSRSVIL